MAAEDPHGWTEATLSRTLRSDHRAILAAVDRLVADEGETEGPGLLATTLTAIEQHLALEEAVLHPRVRSELSNGESEVVRVMAHSARIEQRVRTLQSPDLSPRQRKRLTADLRSLLGEHIDGHEARRVCVVAGS